jgi:EmrB/QacA subfamily drug resistance transporter
VTQAPRAPQERAILFTVGVSGMLVPLNSTMIAVGIPTITKQLHASVAQSGWLVTAYLITMASFQPISGKLGDRYGRRPFILGGVALFAITSVGAALATGIWMLILFRGGQAIAGAIVFPNGAALLRETVPEERRGRSFGMLGSAISFGAAVGPPLGGVLVDLGGWPAIFWANVPLTIVIFAIGWRTIPARQARPSTVRFDLAGAALLAVALSAGAWLLVRMRTATSTQAATVGAIVVVAFIAFVYNELHHGDPVVQPRFFRRTAFTTATSAIATSNLALYSLLLVVPLLLHRRTGWGDARIGFVLTAMSAGMVVLAPIGGRAADRFGRRGPALVGMSLLSVGVCLLAAAGPNVGTTALIAALAMSGAGLGLGASSLQTVAIEAIEPEHAGMAAAASSTSRYMGSIVGSAVLAGLVASPGGFQTILTMTAVGAVLSALLALGLPRRRTRVIFETGADRVAERLRERS